MRNRARILNRSAISIPHCPSTTSGSVSVY
jgi:hypothetical protein